MSRTPLPSDLDGQLLLGTVAIEPNRWGTIRPDRSPETQVTEWADRIRALPVDGLELWEGHLLADGMSPIDDVPVRVLNSYVGFDDDDDADRIEIARRARTCGARAVKFNVGNDLAAADAYGERLGRWVDQLGDDVVPVCECHEGISIAENPAVARRVFDLAGDRVRALVHTHESSDVTAAKFEAFGERIAHVHVNHLDTATFSHPTLAEVEDVLAAKIDQLRSFGFRGSWTLEFVAGLLTTDDHPGALLEQVDTDLAVLRPLLKGS
ncbi:MAG: hypothetical protein RIB65_03985 [Ilumatobacter fluminis]|uniref:hypothetical protein n=1 Tax=Ilumatobacter fluminis TaxID=467091 RepID=UPI0032EFFF2F